MYEANPMGFLIDQAGGSASNAERSILDIEPYALHHRVEIVKSDSAEVEAVTRFHTETMSA